MSDLIFLDMVAGARTILHHSIDVVWPHLLDQKSWMKDFVIETVSGSPNEKGERKKVAPIAVEAQHFFFETLQLVPFRRFVYKAYTESRSGRYGFTGVEILSINDIENDTLVTFEAYLEVQSSMMSRDELGDFVATAKEGSRPMWERNFARLAALLEQSKRGRYTPQRTVP